MHMTEKKKNTPPETTPFEFQLLRSPFLLQSPFLQLNTREGMHNIQLRNIVYCSSDNSLTIFHTAMGMRIIVSKTLTHFEHVLRKYGFERTHQKYLVNLTQIVCFRHGEEGCRLELVSGEKIPVARALKKNITDALRCISVQQQEQQKPPFDLLKIHDSETK